MGPYLRIKVFSLPLCTFKFSLFNTLCLGGLSGLGWGVGEYDCGVEEVAGLGWGVVEGDDCGIEEVAGLRGVVDCGGDDCGGEEVE